MSSRKIAVVTGASSGIGAVYADRMASRGFDLLLVARRQARLDAVAREVEAKHSVRVATLHADLACEDDILRVEHILSCDPEVRALVNCAGTVKMSTIQDTGVVAALGQVAVNITALMRLTLAALPAFLDRNDGLIINIASVLSINVLPISGIYSGTKSFVSHFTQGLQDEVAGSGVRVQLVNPAMTATEIWDVGGLPLSAVKQEAVMTAEDLVDAALAGLDLGEAVTWPSVADATLWDEYERARLRLFAATQTGTPAPRYRLG